MLAEIYPIFPCSGEGQTRSEKETLAPLFSFSLLVFCLDHVQG